MLSGRYRFGFPSEGNVYERAKTLKETSTAGLVRPLRSTLAASRPILRHPLQLPPTPHPRPPLHIPLPRKPHHLPIRIERGRDLRVPGARRGVADVDEGAGREGGFEVRGDEEVRGGVGGEVEWA
jgi:hypothetical protein